jgi:phosphate transport system substrate-binding protein
MRIKLLIAIGATLLATAATAQKIQINGAGATFPYPIYSKWFSEYNKIHPNVEINYQSIGSGRNPPALGSNRFLRRDRRSDDQ